MNALYIFVCIDNRMIPYEIPTMNDNLLYLHSYVLMY